MVWTRQEIRFSFVICLPPERLAPSQRQNTKCQMFKENENNNNNRKIAHINPLQSKLRKDELSKIKLRKLRSQIKRKNCIHVFLLSDITLSQSSFKFICVILVNYMKQAIVVSRE